ncbi:MAG: TolC family protein [Candidatus Omnitrophota bacterium]|nr:TolC family protein [Candidatus Omnitrophota bacterium]
MHKKGATLLYLFVIITVAAISPTVSFPYDQPKEEIIQYITTLSKDIYNSINISDRDIIYSSNGEIKLKVLLSPWGELKDAYVSESSGNKDLDNLCMKAIWVYDRYQPFPEEMGEKDLWVEVPIIFDIDSSRLVRLDGLARTIPDVIARSEATKQSQYSSSESRGVNDAVDLALENHMAAKIAQEEIELSRLKIRETRRALYPAASLNYLETTGKTTGTTQDFTDKEYKLKFEYPLYYGWRLRYAVEQATSNMKASAFNYDKVLHDLKLEVETAFYSYIAARMNLKLHSSLLEEADRIFSIAKKRFDAGLSTKAEYMQVESQFKQINYQIISSENEVIMARLNLMQAMNVGDGEKIIDKIDKYQEKDLEPVNVDIALDDCVNLALKSRPDLKAKEYSLEANDYERKIVESKNQLRVDLTGTYGKSGGAYESETLTLGPDWYLGVKVTKPLGGNTISTAMTKEKTSQKHGQSTRTDSMSKSVEMGLLNNLQQFSEEKSAEIGYKKAMDEVQQARDNIVKEIKDAYLNYKKGLAQISSNLNKIKYREEELKIAKFRAGLNEISLSEFMQANMNFIDEKGYYVEALGSLYQSLAKLNKATGYTLFLDDENFKLANAK